MITLDELQEKYKATWEINTDSIACVYAWRHVALAPKRLGDGSANVLRAWDLDELAEKLAEQEAHQ
ncbi:hypothetical protein AB0I81_45815 [Nonomuraea sp. NPDC050404]|uniref:hypothetical protein n=1 Tax=Nonomuraea sp. NPDC050404 TaxID=3155783 RepID=UPI0033DCC57C